MVSSCQLWRRLPGSEEVCAWGKGGPGAGAKALIFPCLVGSMRSTWQWGGVQTDKGWPPRVAAGPFGSYCYGTYVVGWLGGRVKIC